MAKYNGNEHSKAENDNYANQHNPNNDAYWSSRVDIDEKTSIFDVDFFGIPYDHWR